MSPSAIQRMLLRVCLITILLGVALTQIGSSQVLPSPESGTFFPLLLQRYPTLANIQQLTVTASVHRTIGRYDDVGTMTFQLDNTGAVIVSSTLPHMFSSETLSGPFLRQPCTYTDTDGTSHNVNLVDCGHAIPWIAPLLASAISTAAATRIQVFDDGDQLLHKQLYRRLRFRTSSQAPNDLKAMQLVAQSEITVWYDRLSLLPYEMDYTLHADDDLSTSVPVRCVYDDYNVSRGYPMAYHVTQFVNNAQQLDVRLQAAK